MPDVGIPLSIATGMVEKRMKAFPLRGRWAIRLKRIGRMRWKSFLLYAVY